VPAGSSSSSNRGTHTNPFSSGLLNDAHLDDRWPVSHAMLCSV
jgi:hypothetical protein